ncbi:MAG: cupin domain-containing protein [Sulfolobales archaeon]|nr:cupin domain-containing protein [Sulfolobales archaeon]MCX8186138.1 cupin domain-containing protein [Sulfolobales archaeon]MDW7969433.1 cupin domain-containing protein [Sulfolobales archaeon]
MKFTTKETALYQESETKDRRRWILIVGEKLMLMMVELDPGANVPWHTHIHEQISYVLKGRAEVKTADGIYVFNEGTAYSFRSNEPHETRNPGPDKLVVIEVFSPPREDLLKK